MVEKEDKEIKNKRHQQFADEYMQNGNNATKAYAVVYPTSSVKTQESNGFKLLQNTEIATYISNAQAELAAEASITRADLVQMSMDIYNATKKSKGERSAALKAIEIIAKLTGLNEPEKIDIRGAQVIQILPPNDKED